MPKIRIVAQVIVITLALTMLEFDRVTKFNPDALVLKDADKNPIFVLTKGTSPSLTTKGGIFCAASQEGNIQLTLPIPSTVTPVKRLEYAMDTYGLAMDRLEKTALQAKTALTEIDNTIGAAFSEAEVD